MNRGESRTKANFDIISRIYSEKEKRGWSDYQLAENSGLPQSTLSTWKKRGIEPGIASIEKICDGLGITLSQFFSDETPTDGLSPDQIALIESWKQLSPKQRKAVQLLLDSFSKP